MDAVPRALPTSCRNALDSDVALFLTQNFNIRETSRHTLQSVFNGWWAEHTDASLG